MAINMSSCFVNSERIIHFGRKPVRGGRPPRDKSVRGVMAERMGVLVHEVDKALIVVDLLCQNVRNIENVKIM